MEKFTIEIDKGDLELLLGGLAILTSLFIQAAKQEGASASQIKENSERAFNTLVDAHFAEEKS